MASSERRVHGGNAEVAMTIEFVGWTLVHSVWEGGAIAAIVGVALRSARRTGAATRYVIAVVGLCATVAAPLATTTVWRQLPGASVDAGTSFVRAWPSAMTPANATDATDATGSLQPMKERSEE